MDFSTPWNRFVSPGEPGGGGTKTVQSFVPASTQIRLMIEAGKRLDAQRLAQFDFGEEEEPELEPMALRGPGVDLVDVAEQVSAIEARLQELQRLRAEAERAAAVPPPPPAAAEVPAPAK